MVLKGILWYIQRVCLKNNTQILNKPLGSISKLKDPQSWTCEWHFFPLFSFSLAIEILFFLPLIVVADKIAVFKKPNLYSMLFNFRIETEYQNLDKIRWSQFLHYICQCWQTYLQSPTPSQTQSVYICLIHIYTKLKFIHRSWLHFIDGLRTISG